jgi:hypothetical protein
MHFDPYVVFNDPNVQRMHLEEIRFNEPEDRGDNMKIHSYELLIQVEFLLGKKEDSNAPKN